MPSLKKKSSAYLVSAIKWYVTDKSSLIFFSHRGMTVTSGIVTLQKDSQNLIGISIGGGAPFCPCLYVVQIFDNTPAAKDGTLASGDEIVAVNGQTAKGRTKVEVAKMIQSIKVSEQVNFEQTDLES